MSSVVLDATALCAVLFREPGHENVLPFLSRSLISVVNLSEVLAKAIDKGKDFSISRDFVNKMAVDIVQFDRQQAEFAASLREATTAYGLSLGDRACLALASLRQLPVVTSDGIWEKTGFPVEIIVFRR